MHPLIEPLQRGPAIFYGACEGVWVMVLFAPPRLGDLQLARPALQAMHGAHPGGFPTLTWVLPGAGFSMDSESRQAAATITGEYASSIRAQATLIEGTGFQAAAVRAIISGIDLVARSPAPKKVFGDLRPCLDWCILNRPAMRRTSRPSTELHGALNTVRTSLA